MKKEKRTINLGETFQEKKNIYKKYGDYKTLYQCYTTCSHQKHSIYEKYEKMLFENCERVYCYGINTYNIFMFTLHSIVKKGNKYYYLLITPSYNYFEEIEESEI